MHSILPLGVWVLVRICLQAHMETHNNCNKGYRGSVDLLYISIPPQIYLQISIYLSCNLYIKSSHCYVRVLSSSFSDGFQYKPSTEAARLLSTTRHRYLKKGICKNIYILKGDWADFHAQIRLNLWLWHQKYSSFLPLGSCFGSVLLHSLCSFKLFVIVKL